jgi:hypothetical protein
LPATLNSPSLLYAGAMGASNRLVSDAARDKAAVDPATVHVRGIYALDDRLYAAREGGGGVHPYAKTMAFTINATLPAAHSPLHPMHSAAAAKGKKDATAAPAEPAVDPFALYAIRVEAHVLGVQKHTHAQGRPTPHTINLVLYHKSSLANPLVRAHSHALPAARTPRRLPSLIIAGLSVVGGRCVCADL